MTIEEQKDYESRWRNDLLAKGYQFTTVMWEYEGRQVPMECVLPPPGSEEETKIINAVADFLWDLRHVRKHKTQKPTIADAKPKKRQRVSKPISRK